MIIVAAIPARLAPKMLPNTISDVVSVTHGDVGTASGKMEGVIEGLKEGE
jgi:hypothetical protein